jgi:hypothetical protein
MRQKVSHWIPTAFCAYAGLLILASTRFSVVSWIWGKWAWTWDYFQYSYRNGWGYQYRSDYSFVVVLTYLTAFLLGLIAHGMASTRGGGVWNSVAMILCVLGLVSFTIEGSHWVWEHHLSWIAICPAASLLLAVISIIQLAKNAEQSSRATGARRLDCERSQTT